MLHTYSGVVIGASPIGSIALQTGKYRAMIMGRADNTVVSIINDNYLPATIENGEWEGFYHKRSR